MFGYRKQLYSSKDFLTCWNFQESFANSRLFDLLSELFTHLFPKSLCSINCWVACSFLTCDGGGDGSAKTETLRIQTDSPLPTPLSPAQKYQIGELIIALLMLYISYK